MTSDLSMPPISWDAIKQMNLSDTEKLKWLELISETEKRMFQDTINHLIAEKDIAEDQLRRAQAEILEYKAKYSFSQMSLTSNLGAFPEMNMSSCNELSLENMARLKINRLENENELVLNQLKEAQAEICDLQTKLSFAEMSCSLSESVNVSDYVRSDEILTVRAVPVEYTVDNMPKLSDSARQFFLDHNGCKRCRTLNHAFINCHRVDRYATPSPTPLDSGVTKVPEEYTIENMKKLSFQAGQFFTDNNGCKRCRTLDHTLAQCPRPDRWASSPPDSPLDSNDKSHMNTTFSSSSHSPTLTASTVTQEYKTIYIENLEESLDESKLTKLFIKFGPIYFANVLRDAQGQSRGYGFLSFESPDDARKAVEGMNMKKIRGKQIFVRGAIDKCDMKKTNLFVKNLSGKVNDEMLRQLFAPFGGIISAHVIRDEKTGVSRGYGFIYFTSEDAAVQAAKEMNGVVVCNKPISVEFGKKGNMSGNVSKDHRK